MLGDLLKSAAKLTRNLERPLAWAIQRLPGLFPATALIYILVDIILILPRSAEYREFGWDILRFDRNPTINVFHMKSSRGTLPGDLEGRPDPVKIGADISDGVQMPGAKDRIGKTLVAELNANDFVNSLLFLTEQPNKKLSDRSDAPDGRPTLDVRCEEKGGDKRTFVNQWLYFAAPKLGQLGEIGPDEGPQLAFNQASRVHKIGLSHQEMTQMIQSDVPNLECELFTASNIPVSAVRLIGERRITWYAMISLGALALWIAGAWVLEALRRGVAALD